MASLIPGFEYDIIISHRQKDNKGDKWVSEFVDALRDELINSLTNTDELKVEPSEAINGLLQSQGITNYASVTSSIATKITG